MYDEQKPHEDEIASELLALERQLRGMTPASPRLDRDQLMFAAGQAAGIASVAEPGHDSRAMYDRAGGPMYIAGPSWPGRHFWPAATFTMTAATLLLATMLVWQDRRQPIAEQPVPRQPAVIAINDSQDIETHGLVRLDARNLWPPLPSTNSGYLGVRYVALTRGVGAVPIELPLPGNDELLPNAPPEPVTPRRLLNQLLPVSHPSKTSRS